MTAKENFLSLIEGMEYITEENSNIVIVMVDDILSEEASHIFYMESIIMKDYPNEKLVVRVQERRKGNE